MLGEVLSSGFLHRDQETKYNLTLFDLLLTLATRVNASLKLSKFELANTNRNAQKFQEERP